MDFSKDGGWFSHNELEDAKGFDWDSDFDNMDVGREGMGFKEARAVSKEREIMM